MSDSEFDSTVIATKRVREASFSEEESRAEPMDPKNQVNYLTEIQEQYLSNGESWCLVSKAWYTRWKQYCVRSSSPQPSVRSLGERTPPGPIDNRSIIKNGKLAENLVFDDDVYAVPEVAWEKLVEWYGVNQESEEPLRRLIIGDDTKKSIELYPPQFKVYYVGTSSLTRCPTITLSATNSVTDLINAVKNSLDLTLDTEIQIWTLKEEPTSSYPPTVPVGVLKDAILLDSDTDDLLDRSGDQYIVVEVKDSTTDKFPSEQITTSDASSVSSTSSIFANGFNNLTTSSSTPPPPPGVPRYTRGVCGLQNLGNTCFMNSALQCLSNTPELTKWFLADNYMTDLNRDNPLGMKGQVAEAYGELLKKLWSGHSSSVAPRDFKYTIGRFNSSFSGYQQHDTQELLAFLLDGLHEDLNRILKKPYIELPDFDGMEDSEIADRSWEYHKARNDSVIVDLFQGQFKSKLVCAECDNVSVTFDPFMYLSLPLPIKKKSKTSIVFVPYDPSQQLQRMVVTLNKEASIAHLQKEVAKMMSVEDPETLLVVELFNHKIYKCFPQYEPVANIGTSDIIYVYQLPGPVPPLPKKKARYSYSRYSQPDEDDEEKHPMDENQLIVFPVYCATVTKTESTYSSERISQFGEPIILAVPRKDANKPDLLYHMISQHVERYTQFKLFEEVKEIEETNPFEDEPPKYEEVIEDKTNEFTESTSSAIDEESDQQDMEVDSEQPQNLIHTAAAVTPAGGKKIEPMSNLFAMKVFSEPRYRRAEELLPSVSTWSGLVDLRERAESERKQREEYERQQRESESESEHDTEMEDSIVLPAKISDEEDEQVEDAATLFNSTVKDEEETEAEADDRGSIENASLHSDNNSERSLPNTIAPPAPALPKRKVTCPPSTIIRQGEGILLEWTPKKAQQLFGASRRHSDESGVCTDAWEDMHDLGDPNDDGMSQAQQKKQVTLSDCLDEFTKEEELSGEDLWYCPKCKKHQRATKKFDLWRMPEIMVVHLKRFSHSRTWRDKIDAFIDFPTSELDLTDRVLSIEDHNSVNEEDRLIYDLYGVDNHYGGLGGGHYTSFAQNFEDKHWYNFDDSHVTKVDVNDVKTTAAYLLFYKRRRPLNHDSTRTVEEIMKEAQEKQQAAQDKLAQLNNTNEMEDQVNTQVENSFSEPSFNDVELPPFKSELPSFDSELPSYNDDNEAQNRGQVLPLIVGSPSHTTADAVAPELSENSITELITEKDL